MSIVRGAARTLSAVLMLATAGGTYGESYPDKPIRIVTIGIGSGTDVAARLVSQKMSASMGKPFVIDNRPSSNIPPDIVAHSLPDGYTLLVAPNGFFYNPLLENVPYDPIKDFAPIAMLSNAPGILVVSPTLAVNSVAELIALAKAKPGALNYASAQAGGSGHLTAELFKSMAGVNIVRVAYKATNLAIPDVISGQVQMMFENPAVMVPLMKQGKMKGLAVTSLKPTPLVPGLPPVAETLPGFEMVSTVAMFAPARTPPSIIKRLNEESTRALNDPEVKEKFTNSGLIAIGGKPEELAAWMKSAMASMGKVIKEAGIRVN